MNSVEHKNQWRCSVCDFVYDEQQGLSNNNIDKNTSWEEIPSQWRCPDCGVLKNEFELVRS